MTLTFKSGDIIVGKTVVDLTVGLGRKFSLQLGQVRPGSRIRWTTENDPVLDLREAEDKLSAKVKATALGVGFVYITDGMAEYRLKVTVVPMNDHANEAVTLGGAIGTEEPDQ